MKRITISTSSFFDFNGNNLYIGGAEKYVANLVDLLIKNNYEVEVHQMAHKDFIQDYNGVKVYGWEMRGMDTFSFSRWLQDKFNGRVIYINMAQQTNYLPNSITVSHGIFWDSERENKSVIGYVGAILEPALNQTKIVSVDLNFVNFCRAAFPDISRKNNLFYIPNFVDIDSYKPCDKKDNDYIIITYPRRWQTPRGCDLFKNISDRLLDRFDNIKIHIASNTTDFDWMNNHKHKNRISWKCYSFDEINQAYDITDIAVIPTIECEGISLSALESMASGNAIVSTNIGGLSNMFIGEYNALLVNPNENELYNAVERLILNKELRNRLSKNARDMSFSFRKELWEERWLNLLEDKI